MRKIIDFIKKIFLFRRFGRGSFNTKTSKTVVVLKLFGKVFLGFVAAATLLVAYYAVVLPSPTPATMLSIPESTKILDHNGELLYQVGGEINRTRVDLAQIPVALRNATVVTEDKNFYHHFGFEPRAILRAFWVNLRHGEIRQGASTITQQLARTVLQDNEQTFLRKIKEVILAVKIESRYSKDQILEMYLNAIPYGSSAYGVQAASEMYFGKSVENLTLEEVAYLAALPKAPTYYSPYGPNSSLLQNRAHEVLQKMQAQGYISAEDRQVALQQKVTFTRIPTHIYAPHFVFYVLDYLTRTYGEEKVLRGGIVVTTSLDLNLQKRAEEIVARWGERNAKNYNANNDALVAEDPRTGEILAMVGSRDYFDSSNDGMVNVALSPRQPGSSFKPYVYATAFAFGFNPATMLLDVETDFAADNGGKRYIPHNYSGRNYGPISVRQALAGSLNVPAVKTLVLTGINNSINTAQRLGITTLGDRARFGPALVLGGAEVTLLEHTAALGAFGVGGVKHVLAPVLKITDQAGQLIYQHTPDAGTIVVDSQIAYLINNILSDNQARKFIFGSHNRLEIPGRSVAVKTGTTQNFRDGWTLGYTPSLAVGVWVGNNDNSPMRPGSDGSVVAAPIWNEFMSLTLAEHPAEEFVKPSGIVEMNVDALSGKLPTQYTPSTKKEIFASFNAPAAVDDVHVQIAENDFTAVVTNFHSEKPNDPLWENPVSHWAESAGFASVDTNLAGRQNYPNSPIVFSVPADITKLPWEISLQTNLNTEVSFTEVFLDGKLILTHSTGNFHYADSVFQNPGPHLFSAVIHTTSGETFTISRSAEFAVLNDPSTVATIPVDVGGSAEAGIKN